MKDPHQTLAGFVGERIKRLRTQRHYSLRDLAERAGVSAAMISEIERGKKSPTVMTMNALASGLAVPTSYLFEQDRAIDGIMVTRRREHRTVPIGVGATNVVLGHPIKGSNLHWVRLDLRKDAGNDLLSAHPAGSLERAHVVEGRVELMVSDEKVRLGPGDSCSFLGELPHCYRNVGRGTAKIYLVVEFASG
ncbi:MAG TPA: XRE family transcriptional regulator [Candidatus Baltobacteraceae bacterium]|jgi:transcriptional regulator with XRE-family HTH domain|nr:XRE family transcriptional regulator [Candidatus Baltobacteraceae bacterium]